MEPESPTVNSVGKVQFVVLRDLDTPVKVEATTDEAIRTPRRSKKRDKD